MPLQTKYRPVALDGIYGNATLITAIKAALAREDCNRSILLHGPSGCGKTTIARAIAHELGCLGDDGPGPDYHELNTSDFRGIDMVREIRQSSQFIPKGQWRIWFLDECHKLSPDAQEAILKLLEHPPASTWFILATTEVTKLKVTVRRRCAEYRVEGLDDDILLALLRRVSREEGTRLPKDLLMGILRDSHGSPGLALSIMDRVIGLPEEEMADAARVAAEQSDAAIELCRLIAKGAKWKALAEVLKKIDKEDPEGVRRVALEYFRKVLLGGAEWAYDVLVCFSRPIYDIGPAGLAMAVFEAAEAVRGN